MPQVIIASTNPVKIQAVKNGFRQMFTEQNFEFKGVVVPSDVASQPMSNSETYLGAKNRANNANRLIAGAKYYVGIEGGVELIGNEMEVFAWVVIKQAENYGKARTGTFDLPQKIVNLIQAGKELGEADDIVFNQKNSKQDKGAVGILTRNIIDRTQYYTQAVVLALIPFKNRDLYFNLRT